MSEDILSAALVAQLAAERDDWRGRAERAEAEAAGTLAELSSYRASLLVLQQALAAERRRIALRFAADPRWCGDYADAMGLMLEEKEETA